MCDKSLTRNKNGITDDFENCFKTLSKLSYIDILFLFSYKVFAMMYWLLLVGDSEIFEIGICVSMFSKVS